MYQLVSVLRQRVFFSPVPTLAAAQAPIKSKLSNNLKKDLDNYPDLHDIIKNTETNDKTIKKWRSILGKIPKLK